MRYCAFSGQSTPTRSRELSPRTRTAGELCTLVPPPPWRLDGHGVGRMRQARVAGSGYGASKLVPDALLQKLQARRVLEPSAGRVLRVACAREASEIRREARPSVGGLSFLLLSSGADVGLIPIQNPRRNEPREFEPVAGQLLC